MSRPKKIYALYKHDAHKHTGYVEDLAEYSGLSVHTIYKYASTTKRGVWDVVPIDETVPFGNVDVQQIRALMDKNNITIKALGELLGFSAATMSLRLSEELCFKESELELIEDLFFLDNQTLYKERVL